jgi:hypothetical protein
MLSTKNYVDRPKTNSAIALTKIILKICTFFIKKQWFYKEKTIDKSAFWTLEIHKCFWFLIIHIRVWLVPYFISRVAVGLCFGERFAYVSLSSLTQ